MLIIYVLEALQKNIVYSAFPLGLSLAVLEIRRGQNSIGSVGTAGNYIFHSDV